MTLNSPHFFTSPPLHNSPHINTMGTSLHRVITTFEKIYKQLGISIEEKEKNDSPSIGSISEEKDIEEKNDLTTIGPIVSL